MTVTIRSLNLIINLMAPNSTFTINHHHSWPIQTTLRDGPGEQASSKVPT